MVGYYMLWTPANLAEDGEAVVVVRYQEDAGKEPVELFRDYQHTTYGNYIHEFEIYHRILGYHIGHEPDRDTTARFITEAKPSPAVITKKELQAFFQETDERPALKF